MTGEEQPTEAAPAAPAQPPAAPPQAPPTELTPEAQIAAAETGWSAPSQVMDQDDLDAKVTVNVEQVFSEIFMVKILGVLFFVLAGVLAFLPALLAGEEITTILPALILGVVGMVFGIIGFFVRSLRKWMIYLAPSLLIAAVAVRPLTSAVGSLDTMDIILSLAFAVSWFLALEYLHALSRFVEVGEMAIKRRLTNFNLSGVVKHFLGWGFLMLGIIILVTLGIIGLVPLMGNAFWTMIALGGLLIIVGTLGTILLLTQGNLTQGLLFALASYGPGVVIIVIGVVFMEGDGLIGDSAELWSVFGIAMAAAVVFTMMGLILTVWYAFMEGTAKVEKVEYSREKLQEMLASGQVLDLEESPGMMPGGGETP
jgi:hypothetical protein